MKAEICELQGLWEALPPQASAPPPAAGEARTAFWAPRGREAQASGDEKHTTAVAQPPPGGRLAEGFPWALCGPSLHPTPRHAASAAVHGCLCVQELAQP